MRTTGKILAAFAAAFAVHGLAQAAATAQTIKRDFRVEEERSYASGGESASVSELRLTSKRDRDGTWRHDYDLKGSLVYDPSWGAVGAAAKKLAQISAVVSPDRRSIEMPGLGAGALKFVNDSAALGAAGGGAGCTVRSETVALPVAFAAGQSTSSIKFDIAPDTAGFCVVRYESVRLPYTGADDKGATLSVRGIALTTPDFADVLVSAVRFEGVAQAQPFSGTRMTVLRKLDGRAVPDAALDRFESLPGSTMFMPKMYPAGGGDPLLAPVLSIEAQQASVASGAIEAAALAFAEQRVNPVPLIAIGAAVYLGDQAIAAVANGAGYGIKMAGQAAGNQFFTDFGDAMTEYNGIGGEALQYVARATTRAFGGGQTAVNRADTAAGIVYSIPAIFMSGGVGAAAQPQIAKTLLANPRLNGVVYQLMVADDRIALAGDVAGLGNDIFDLVDGERWFNAGLDWAMGVGDRPLSLTPSPQQLMSQTTAKNSPKAGANNTNATGTRSPFVASTDGTVSTSTAGLADVTISGLLTFRVYDHAAQDGDIVDLSVDPSGFGITLSITNAGNVFTIPNLKEGTLATIRLLALNEGTSSPNTGAIEIQGFVVSGTATQFYNLNTGGVGLMRVLILGRRAK